MNTKGLGKLYDRLTPRERLPLMLAASTRGDEAEAERLRRSAPHKTFSVPDSHGWSEGLFAVTALYLLTQLELAARFWQASVQLALAPREGLGGAGAQRSDVLSSAVRLLAFQIGVQADAWKLFCAGLTIDPEALVRDQPRTELLRRTVTAAGAVAFTAAEALAYLTPSVEPGEAEGNPASAGQRESRLETAAEVAQGLRDFVMRRVQAW